MPNIYFPLSFNVFIIVIRLTSDILYFYSNVPTSIVTDSILPVYNENTLLF